MADEKKPGALIIGIGKEPPPGEELPEDEGVESEAMKLSAVKAMRSAKSDEEYLAAFKELHEMCSAEGY